MINYYIKSIASAVGTVDWSNILNKPSIFSGNYADLSNKPTLFSGSYNDLSDKPNIPDVQVNSDWNSISGISQILNKPTLATVATSGDYADLSNKPDFSNYTTQGNTFNGVNQLVKLDGSGKLPAIDGSALTNLPTGGTDTASQIKTKLETLVDNDRLDSTAIKNLPDITNGNTAYNALVTIGQTTGVLQTKGDGSITGNTALLESTIQFYVDNGSSDITTGAKAWVKIPYACTITAWEISASSSGSITIDVWSNNSGNLPLDVADSICNGNKITLSSQPYNQDNDVADWIESIPANNYVQLNVDSCTGIKKALIILKVVRV